MRKKKSDELCDHKLRDRDKQGKYSKVFLQRNASRNEHVGKKQNMRASTVKWMDRRTVRGIHHMRAPILDKIQGLRSARARKNTTKCVGGRKKRPTIWFDAPSDLTMPRGTGAELIALCCAVLCACWRWRWHLLIGSTGAICEDKKNMKSTERRQSNGDIKKTSARTHYRYLLPLGT